MWCVARDYCNFFVFINWDEVSLKNDKNFDKQRNDFAYISIHIYTDKDRQRQDKNDKTTQNFKFLLLTSFLSLSMRLTIWTYHHHHHHQHNTQHNNNSFFFVYNFITITGSDFFRQGFIIIIVCLLPCVIKRFFFGLIE